MSEEKKSGGFVPPTIKKHDNVPSWMQRPAEERPKPAQSAQAQDKPKPQPRPEVPSGGSAPKADDYTYYTIQKGDCLIKIAEKFGCTVEQLQEWNGLFDDADKDGVMDAGEKGHTRIYAGDRLRVGKKKPGGGW